MAGIEAPLQIANTTRQIIQTVNEFSKVQETSLVHWFMSSISSLELFLSHLLLNPALLYLKILRVLRQTYKWDQKNQSIQIRQPIRDILIKEITMLFNWVSTLVPILKP